jgi:hypothetical protein
MLAVDISSSLSPQEVLAEVINCRRNDPYSLDLIGQQRELSTFIATLK